MSDSTMKKYSDEWVKIRNEVLDDWGFDEEDLENDEMEETSEDEINRETDDRFKIRFGFDLVDVLTS